MDLALIAFIVSLFILYMNDLPLHIDNNIDMFADDSTLYTSGHNVDEIQRSLQNNLNAVTISVSDIWVSLRIRSKVLSWNIPIAG